MPMTKNAGKFTTNFIFLVVNPLYNFVLTALTGVYQLSITAKGIPILGSVFALIALTLKSIITVLDSKKTTNEKILALFITGVISSLIIAAISVVGALASASLGIVITGVMTFLQVGDLGEKISKYLSIKKESDSKEQLLKALNEDDAHKALPLTETIYKWAIIYSKMVAVEKKIPNLDPNELQHYDNIEKKLRELIQRFNSQPIDTAEEEKFHQALRENTLDKLPQNEEFYKLARNLRKTMHGKQQTEFKEQETKLNKYIRNYDFVRSTKIFDYFTLQVEPDTKNQILQALKKGKEIELPLEANIYKWGKVFSNIVQRELQAPYLSAEDKTRYENLARKLNNLVTRFDGLNDFDKTAIDTESFDLESLETKKLDILQDAKKDPANAKVYSQQLLAMNNRINKIAVPLAKLREKKDKAILNIAYSSCDLLLALAGIALASLGLVAILAGAPITIPAIVTGLGIAIGAVAICRGGLKIIFDLINKWDSHKDEELKLQEIENHITSPELYERPQHMKSSDLSMLAVFRKNPAKPVDNKEKTVVQTSAVTVENSAASALSPTVQSIAPKPKAANDDAEGEGKGTNLSI